ncbi:hypothetical protein M8C21_001120 [Ambrosia artemisiifolia]|uniref:Uncharacterized protein n=1 Tax=Ambrosia artemisiifolia TaxID=4212 RepID=A0AAD5BR04_AMBAR|nr:hypothetical protein M8C21_001120 [Ambrosia artemisiifolia]
MTTPAKDPLMQVETCGSLLQELQIIWDEVGECDVEKDKMLLELKRECLEAYRRKVDLANRSRAQIRQAIADSICCTMGERPMHIRQSDQNIQSLKAELGAILPELEEMRKRKSERKNQFIEVITGNAVGSRLRVREVEHWFERGKLTHAPNTIPFCT